MWNLARVPGRDAGEVVRMAAATLFTLLSTSSLLNAAKPTLDPLALLQDKASQITTLRSSSPPQGLETATLALG